jgi:hypothetical protein
MEDAPDKPIEIGAPRFIQIALRRDQAREDLNDFVHVICGILLGVCLTLYFIGIVDSENIPGL